MPLVGAAGRKRVRARVAMLALYLFLIAGVVVTIYPFLLMVSTGFKGPTDQNDNHLIPTYWSTTSRQVDGKLDPSSLKAKYLADKYAGDQSMIDSTRIGSSATSELTVEYEKFLMRLEPNQWMAGFRIGSGQSTSRLNLLYQTWLRNKFGSIDQLNKAYVEENLAFETVTPPIELLEKVNWAPKQGRKYSEWLEFKLTLPTEFRIPVRRQRMWQEYLRSRYQNQLTDVPKNLVGKATKFEELILPDRNSQLPPVPADSTRCADSVTFVSSWIPARYAFVPEADILWQSIHGQDLPIEAFENTLLQTKAGQIKREFSGRNFRYVLSYILLNGDSLKNTFVFCLLAILTQLIVNPLAAYALSRYPIRAGGKILVFLLATMAFPAEVAMIPNFLLLKDLGLLNTFLALVLPSAASGYMIFLLKGFFDSLPSELFEAGQLDGARETTMMTRIALPLSRPVLGYLALVAFMGAYSAFMYAFLVCQDQRMWTLMVWIYQLQVVAPRAVTMAALTLAAIPTIIVFLLAQGVIMRGVVLPGER